MSKLIPMTQTEYDAFLKRTIPEYADDKVRAGYWVESEALERSRKEFEGLLPKKLYQKFGFKSIRRLVGYKLENPQVDSLEKLEEMDIRELARQVTYHGLKDLPWQLSGVTIAQHTPPSRAFRLNDACCLISNPEAEHVVIWSVLVNVHSRGAGLSQVLMRAVLSRFPNKIWHVPTLYPEEISAVFDRVGMKREEISQWQMSLIL